MFDRFQSLLGRIMPQHLDALLEQQLQHAIKVIDPRLQSFGNYPRAYLKSIAAAYDYAGKLAQSLPEPIDLSPRRFASDPLLHALFTDVEAIHATVRDSLEIKHYCHQHGKPEGGELFALMGMRRHEKTVLGREVRGEQIQPDVKQTLVYFDSHTLSLPVVEREEFAERLTQHLFDSLLQSFRAHLGEVLKLKRELEAERDIMAARQRSHTQPLNGGEEARLDTLRREVARLGEEYALANYPSLLARFIENRQQHLRMERSEIPIDMRGVVRESDERLGGRFTFHDLIGRDRRRWTLCPVRLPVDELVDVMHCSGVGNERWMSV